jgi:hypothetical protein
MPWRPLFHLLQVTLLWAFASSFTSAAVSGLGRTLCLPPYWPPQYVLRCREGRILEALVHMPLDIGVTTLLLFVPALIPGVIVVVLLYLSRTKVEANRSVRAVIVTAGAVMWFLLVKKLEPSYLDFIIGGYAIVAGAMAGALTAVKLVPSSFPGVAGSSAQNGKR